jgi:Tfp pilus assembly protein PilP
VVLHVVSSVLCALVIFNQAPTTDSLLPVEKWEYRAGGRRDPFVPLIGSELAAGGQVSQLSVENIRLIGILWGEKGYYGLVKDGQNNGYILKKGDKVAGGRVVDINRKGIIFEITHAGVVTKYELMLQEKERR